MIGKEEWLGRKSGSRKSGWGGRVVREEEWLGRKGGCWGGGRVVGEEEWLGKRSGSGGGVVGEEE